MIILGILSLVNLSLEFILYLWKGLLWEISFFFFFNFTAALHSMWDLSSPAREWTWDPYSESTESQPLDH